MDRQDFLKKAQNASFKRGNRWELKEDDLVVYDSKKYIPNKYILWFECDKPRHSVELIDRNNNSIIIANLKDVGFVGD